MVYLLALIFIPALILHAPLLWWRARRDTLSRLDWFYPILGVGLWALITIAGVGSQSLANLIEVAIVLGVSLLGYASILLVASGNHKNKLYALSAVIVLLVVLLRLLFPALPE